MLEGIQRFIQIYDLSESKCLVQDLPPKFSTKTAFMNSLFCGNLG